MADTADLLSYCLNSDNACADNSNWCLCLFQCSTNQTVIDNAGGFCSANLEFFPGDQEFCIESCSSVTEAAQEFSLTETQIVGVANGTTLAGGDAVNSTPTCIRYCSEQTFSDTICVQQTSANNTTVNQIYSRQEICPQVQRGNITITAAQDTNNLIECAEANCRDQTDLSCCKDSCQPDNHKICSFDFGRLMDYCDAFCENPDRVLDVFQGVDCQDATCEGCCNLGVRNPLGAPEFGWNYQGHIICDSTWTEHETTETYCSAWDQDNSLRVMRCSNINPETETCDARGDCAIERCMVQFIDICTGNSQELVGFHDKLHLCIDDPTLSTVPDIKKCFDENNNQRPCTRVDCCAKEIQNGYLGTAICDNNFTFYPTLVEYCEALLDEHNETVTNYLTCPFVNPVTEVCSVPADCCKERCAFGDNICAEDNNSILTTRMYCDQVCAPEALDISGRECR